MNEKLWNLIERWQEFARKSGNADWTDGIRRCADELESLLMASEKEAESAQPKARN